MRITPPHLRLGLLCTGLLVLCTPRLQAADPPTQSAAEVLSGHGLRQFGRVWMIADEVRLREELTELPRRRERILALERDLNERIERNRKEWQAAQPAIAALRKTLSRLGSDDPQRALVQQQIDALASASAEPAKLAGRGDVRARVIEWTDERHGLVTAIAQIRQAIAALPAAYERLAQTPCIAEALRQAGDKQRLGPQRSYDGDREKLPEYERLAFTPWVPIFLQGSRVRVAALIDDRAPVTFTWSDSGGPGIVLTRTAAEAAGLVILPNAPREIVSHSPQQRATARRIEVASFRLGQLVLHQASVLVLSPEAEDWGCELCRDALSGHSVRLEPERLRLVID